jgi:hypothetical protein
MAQHFGSAIGLQTNERARSGSEVYFPKSPMGRS